MSGRLTSPVVYGRHSTGACRSAHVIRHEPRGYSPLFFGPYEVLEVLDILVRMVFSLSALACKRKKVQPRNCFAGCVAMHLLTYPHYKVPSCSVPRPVDAPARAAFKPLPCDHLLYRLGSLRVYSTSACGTRRAPPPALRTVGLITVHPPMRTEPMGSPPVPLTSSSLQSVHTSACQPPADRGQPCRLQG
jgi:hypothetical protein